MSDARLPSHTNHRAVMVRRCQAFGNQPVNHLFLGMSSKEVKMRYTEPSTEAKLWVVDRIAQFINDTQGHGTFRTMNDYLNLDYTDSYSAGGMTITNALWGERKQ